MSDRDPLEEADSQRILNRVADTTENVERLANALYLDAEADEINYMPIDERRAVARRVLAFLRGETYV